MPLECMARDSYCPLTMDSWTRDKTRSSVSSSHTRASRASTYSTASTSSQQLQRRPHIRRRQPHAVRENVKENEEEEEVYGVDVCVFVSFPNVLSADPHWSLIPNVLTSCSTFSVPRQSPSMVLRRRRDSSLLNNISPRMHPRLILVPLCYLITLCSRSKPSSSSGKNSSTLPYRLRMGSPLQMQTG